MKNEMKKPTSFRELTQGARKALPTARRTLHLLWEFNPRLFIALIIVQVTTSSWPFLNAYIYKLLIDKLTDTYTTGIIEYYPFLLLILARVSVSIAMDVEKMAHNLLYERYRLLFPAHVEDKLLKTVGTLSLEQFEDSTFRDKLHRASWSHSHQVVNMLHRTLHLGRSALQAIFALGAVGYLHPLLIPLTILATLPALFISSLSGYERYGRFSQNTPLFRTVEYIRELLLYPRSVKELTLYNLREYLRKIHAQARNKALANELRQATRDIRLNTFADGIQTLFTLALEASFIIAALLKKITIGDISFYSTVLSRFQTSLDGMMRGFSQIIESGLYVQDVFDIIDATPQIKQETASVTLDIDTPPLIECINVHFTYPQSDKEIFSGLNLTIQPGERVAIVGENGSGKSTLIKLILRLYETTDGDIRINQVPIQNLDLTSWHKGIAVLFQDFLQYEFPLEDNIYFGRVQNKKKREDIMHAARLGGADGVAKELSKGYRQMLGRTFDGGVELSGGQWQKVALARAFYRNAPVLILDEPTASVDARAESEIFERVDRLMKGKTVIIISHRFSTVKTADTIVVLHKGKIIERGSHKELMTKNGHYAELYSLQARAYQD